MRRTFAVLAASLLVSVLLDRLHAVEPSDTHS